MHVSDKRRNDYYNNDYAKYVWNREFIRKWFTLNNK